MAILVVDAFGRLGYTHYLDPETRDYLAIKIQSPDYKAVIKELIKKHARVNPPC